MGKELQARAGQGSRAGCSRNLEEGPRAQPGRGRGAWGKSPRGNGEAGGTKGQHGPWYTLDVSLILWEV